MTDDKADNITEPSGDVATTESQATPEQQVETPQSDENKLSGLMADPASPAPSEAKKPAVDLEKQALAAAEQALAQGEQALAEANEQLQQEAARPKPQPATSSKRELALRVLLAVNVLAMVVVALLPNPTPDTQPKPAETGKHQPSPQPSTPAMSQPWNQALLASEQRDYGKAVAILEGYLADKPRMAPSERLSVLTTLANYAAKNGDRTKSEDFLRKAHALEQSHSLPEDLVKEAEAALERGDQESLRRVWARFLLQQRQIPTWLYQHVAQAYLQLGDSYRQDADAAERVAREQELEAAAARLRAEAAGRGK